MIDFSSTTEGMGEGLSASPMVGGKLGLCTGIPMTGCGAPMLRGGVPCCSLAGAWLFHGLETGASSGANIGAGVGACKGIKQLLQSPQGENALRM